MLNLKIVLSIIASVVVINLLVKLKFSAPEVEEEISTEAQAPSKKTPYKRTPASARPATKIAAQAPVIPQSEVSRSDLDQSNFEVPPEVVSSSKGATSVIGAGGGNFANRNSVSAPPELSRKPLEQTQPKKISATDSPARILVNPVLPVIHKPEKPLIVQPPKVEIEQTAAPVAGLNSCSPSKVAGSFSNPIAVSLNCAYTSQIKYCLAVDTGAGCCDPLAASTDYTTDVIVGSSTNATYCLSFYGESATNGTSETYQYRYTINSTLPNLLVNHPVTYFQTTQLEGKSFYTSTDFGKSGYGIGEINLKSHDPNALNLSCEEIVSNYVSLPVPLAQSVLAWLDVSGDNPSLQIEIPLRQSFLDYGENFVTSYMENRSFVAPLYSCSTTKITLNDFEFFDNEVAFGDEGTNSVREFSGGLSSYGFFEDEATVFRGPAGVSANTQTGQQLQSGLFGIFY